MLARRGLGRGGATRRPSADEPPGRGVDNPTSTAGVATTRSPGRPTVTAARVAEAPRHIPGASRPGLSDPRSPTMLHGSTKRGVAARVGSWSARHKKSVLLGWLAFVVVSVVLGASI